MSFKSLLTIACATLVLSSQAFARSLPEELAKRNNCEIVYVNVSESDAFSPAHYASAELRKSLYEKGIVYELNDVFMYDTEGVDYRENNSTKIMKANSIVLDLSSETDMTGSEVKVSIYKIDSKGRALFVAERMESAKFEKTKIQKLVGISKLALELACGL